MIEDIATKNILVVGTKERKEVLYNAILNKVGKEACLVDIDVVDSKRVETIAKYVRSLNKLDLIVFFGDYVSAAPEFKRLCNRDSDLYNGKTAAISKVGKPAEDEIKNSVDYASQGLLVDYNIDAIFDLLDQN